MVVLRDHKGDHEPMVSGKLEAEVHHGIYVALGRKRDGHRMMPITM